MRRSSVAAVTTVARPLPDGASGFGSRGGAAGQLPSGVRWGGKGGPKMASCGVGGCIEATMPDNVGEGMCSDTNK